MKNVYAFIFLIVAFTFNTFGQQAIKNNQAVGQRFQQTTSSAFGGKHKKTNPAQIPSFSYQFVQGGSSPSAPAPLVNSLPYKPSPALNFKRAESGAALTIFRDSHTGMPLEITGLKHNLIDDNHLTTEVKALLPKLSIHLVLKEAENEFSIIQSSTDDLGFRHVKLQQEFKGVKVYGAQAWLHFEPDGNVYFNGRTRPTPNITTVQPKVNKVVAENIALADFDETSKMHEDHFLPGLKRFETELVILPAESRLNEFLLAWHITVRPDNLHRWEYFVDATTGKVADKYYNTCTLGPTTANVNDLAGVSRTINVFQDGSTYYMINTAKDMYTGSQTTKPGTGKGSIITLNMQNTSTNNPSYVEITSSNNTNWSPTAVSAHANASLCYDYFKSTFNRKSIDGKGGDVISFINVADANGSGLDNAFWNGQYMFYGNGNIGFTPLAKSLDVGGHEMAHGVTQETANLEYKNEPGALNEHFSDVFGVMIDRDDWTLGEGVTKTSYIPTGVLRSMADPHNGGSSLNDNGWQPKHMNEKYNGTDDNGGVHINSGIPNHAFYLIANAIGKAKAEQIYYRALTNYLTKTSKFIDMRLAIVKAATDLHGANSTETNTVKQSFDAVGIFDGNGSGTPGNLPTNPGSEQLVVAETNAQAANRLYITDAAAQNFTPISQLSQMRRVSVTDDGNLALFVGTDNNIYAVNLNAPYQQTQLTTDAFWDNVAISRDGQRLAAISKNIDTAIYVYDDAKNQWAKYRLYNPTTGQGVSTGGVLYADALEWDYTGEYVLYDAYNEIKNVSGTSLDFWDMGFLRVWNKAGNNFGDGTVFKVFTSLEEGVNIGNATFSKNSPYIIAFDYQDTKTGDLYILASNLETNTVGTVFNNVIFGTPSYSKTDGKIAFSANNQQGVECVAFIDMAADKITGNASSAVIAITEAKWPVWFAKGQRTLPSGLENIEAAATFKLYPNPVNSILSLEKAASFAKDAKVQIVNMLGEVVPATIHISNMNTGKLVVDVAHLPKGSYLISIREGGATQTLRFVKTE